MDARDDRKTMAGILQRTVAAARDNSGKDCPGPDLLAAYCEQALSPAERQHWEAHFSTCGLCQAQLAALARSEPQRQPGPLWFWRWHWAWKWLPPAAVALTAIAIWIAVRPSNPLHQLEKKPLEVATTAPATANQQYESKEAMRVESAAPPAPESTSKAKPNPASVEKQKGKSAEPAIANSEYAATLRSKEMAQGALARTAPPAVAEKRALPPPAAENATPSGTVGALMEDKAVQGGVTAAANASAAAPSPAPSPSTTARAESSTNKMRSGYAAGTASDAFQARQLQVLEARSAEVLIESPDPAVQWRIGRAGTIERTTDGGKTWQGQFVNGRPGLVAGSAPSAKVCWVVGRAGAILRTKDGEKWEKIAPPAMIDLAGINAKDEKSATITTADGRSFSTQDGGKRWQLVQQDR